MQLPTKMFHQYTKDGNFISSDGWAIVPDPLVEDGDNSRRVWRLLSPTGKQVLESFSPTNMQPIQFELIAHSYHKLRREDLRNELSIDEIISSTFH